MLDGKQRPASEHLASSWQDLLNEGRVADALSAYYAGDEDNLAIGGMLKDLLNVQRNLREKAWRKAKDLSKTIALSSLNKQSMVEEIDRLQEASDALNKRKPEDALALLDDVYTSLLKGEANTLRGTAFIYLNDPERARASFDAALAIDPKHYRAITNLGNLALEAGEVDSAIASYERALAINEGFSNAHHNLGVALRKKGQITKSVRSLKKAQGAAQRQAREEARESMRSNNISPKLFRWGFIVIIALLFIWFLSSQGFI